MKHMVMNGNAIYHYIIIETYENIENNNTFDNWHMSLKIHENTTWPYDTVFRSLIMN